MKYSFFKTPSNLFEICRDLNDGEKLGLMVLLKHSDKEHKCFPSYNKIAELLGKTRNSAIRIIKGLVEKDYINKKIRYSKKYNNFFNTSNEYTINISKISKINDIKESIKKTISVENKQEKNTVGILDITEEVFKDKKVSDDLKTNLKDRFLEVYNSKNIRNPKKYLETMIDNAGSKSINYKSSNNLKTKFHNFEERNDYSEEDYFNILTKNRYIESENTQVMESLAEIEAEIENTPVIESKVKLSDEILAKINEFIKVQSEFVNIKNFSDCKNAMIEYLEKEDSVIDRLKLMYAFNFAKSKLA